MTSFRFRNFQVYQDAKEFNKKIFKLSKVFPVELKSQTIRSSISILLNIAEGSAKKSDKDFNRYIENSLGSINEIVACLEIAYELNFITQFIFNDLSNEAENIARQLGGLSKKLKVNNKC